jgi:hypothetical protein
MSSFAQIGLASVLVLLTSCGGGGSTPAGGTPTTSAFSGVAVDGYLYLARAFLDLNGNGTYDNGEPTAITASDGTFTLTATQDQINSHSVVVSAIAGTTIDQDTPNTPLTSGFTMMSPAGSHSVVSPLTTQVAAKMAGGLTLELAKAAVKNELGLTSIDVMKNYVAEKATNSAYADAHKVAASVAEVLKTVDSSSNTTTTLTEKLTSLSTKVTSQVAPQVIQIKASVTVNDAKNVTVNVINSANLTFNNVTAAEPNQTSTSNTVTVSGLSISSNGTIIKNGNPLTSKYAALQNGDSIALQTVSGVSSSVTTVTGNVGALTISWVVTSRSPQVNLQYGLLPSGPTIENHGANTTDSSLYFAYPIVPASSFVANYIGIGGVQSGLSISIYSDTSAQPGASLASASFGTYLAASTLTSSNGTSYTLPANGLGEASFGANGPSLTVNTPYWVVIHLPSAGRIGTIWQGVNGYLTGACTRGQSCPQPTPPSTPAPRVAMKSSDGITWTAITGYEGIVGTSNNTIMPLIYLTN